MMKGKICLVGVGECLGGEPCLAMKNSSAGSSVALLVNTANRKGGAWTSEVMNSLGRCEVFKSSCFVMEGCIAWNGGCDCREDLFGFECNRLGNRS